jgi:hypothetical protein
MSRRRRVVNEPSSMSPAATQPLGGNRRAASLVPDVAGDSFTPCGRVLASASMLVEKVVLPFTGDVHVCLGLAVLDKSDLIQGTL